MAFGVVDLLEVGVVHDHEIEGPVAAILETFGHAAEQVGPGDDPALGEFRMLPFKDRQRDLPLLAADPRRCGCRG